MKRLGASVIVLLLSISLFTGLIDAAAGGQVSRTPGSEGAQPEPFAPAGVTSSCPPPGSLDLSFDGDGKVTTDFFGRSDFGDSVAIQGDGKIVVAGDAYYGSYADFGLARYNADGSLDPSFDVDGMVTTDFGSADSVSAMAIQGDGKIVVAGATGIYPNDDFALARYQPDGSLDASFGLSGTVTTDFGSGDLGIAVAIQGDGKILVAGRALNGSSFDFALARYQPDGSLDGSFDGDGRVTTDFSGFTDSGASVAIQGDGKIVVAGKASNGNDWDFALARYLADGSLDASFDGDGKVTTDFGSAESGTAVAIQADGRIVVAGDAYNGSNADFALARYHPDGSLDASFDGDGKATTDFFGYNDFGGAIAIQGDGKIVVAGDAHNGSDRDFALARYNADGSLDASFSGDGKVTTDFFGDPDAGTSVAMQGDGKIVVAGRAGIIRSDFALARYWEGTKVFHVDDTAAGAGDGSSWGDAFTDLQSALAAANRCDEIWAAAGVYMPTLQSDTDPRSATFQLPAGVAIYGGFDGTETSRDQRDWSANLTILSGDIDNNDQTNAEGVVTDTANIQGGNAYHVVSGGWVTETAVLDGFTITGGQATGTWDSGYDIGGGMLNDGGSPTLANLVFSGNTTDRDGGGMYNANSSSPRLTNVTFFGNEASQWSGGGMYNNNSNPALVNVSFIGNRAAFVGGGMCNSDSMPTLANVIFSGNSTLQDGGGLVNWNGSNPTLVNVTFSGNEAGNFGGGMYNNLNSVPIVQNSIFWNNKDSSGTDTANASIYTENGSGIAYSNSLIQGWGTPIDSDPFFVRNPDSGDGDWTTLGDNDYGDLQLQTGSPAIDQGNNADLPTDVYDLDGDGDTSEPIPYDLLGYSRVVNGTVDMGACEHLFAVYLPAVLK